MNISIFTNQKRNDLLLESTNNFFFKYINLYKKQCNTINSSTVHTSRHQTEEFKTLERQPSYHCASAGLLCKSTDYGCPQNDLSDTKTRHQRLGHSTITATLLLVPTEEPSRRGRISGNLNGTTSISNTNGLI